MVQILGRKTKSSAVLLGEPGVGKSAVAEGVAASIASGALPDGSPLPRFLVCLLHDVAIWSWQGKQRHWKTAIERIFSRRMFWCGHKLRVLTEGPAGALQHGWNSGNSYSVKVQMQQHEAYTGSTPERPCAQTAKRVMMLDVALLIAGAKERGELELRVSGLLADAAAAGDVIFM